MKSIRIMSDLDSVKTGYYFRAINDARRILNSEEPKVDTVELHRQKSVFMSLSNV